MNDDTNEVRPEQTVSAEAADGPEWKPVNRANTYELVIDAVEEQIMTGSLGVGDPLPAERDLATKLGVSRASVREALRVLDSLGVVRSSGGSGRGAGTFIAAMPSAALTRFLRLHVALTNFSIDDVTETRIQLERSSAILAATRADKDALAEVNAQLAMMDTPGISLETFNDADTAFHVAIAQAAGNQLFSDLTGAIRTSLRKSIFSSFSRVDDQQALMAKLQAQHHGIMDAITAGRAEEAAALTEEHIRFAASQLPGLSPD
ncbi:FadR/GntR family transcriptional regulator [Brevibacterium linens]|uniref:FadR/GntR family transcriptional regulator n=1 Tax=Brevibacterium linens TaxID=1703 RepID=UPI000FC9F686|nr:FCD domain-containing protein [Brevibacterium linens]AZU02501.1 GntR family transcriptional regulator [Brevibacterium linens]